MKSHDRNTNHNFSAENKAGKYTVASLQGDQIGRIFAQGVNFAQLL
jgi:hypothetical protein